ncbi:MAG: response regulator transcription factor, partial [Ignavibacteria bacterium]|nr:response regulator transcription factor [Ignavibacteria bacterium]
ELLARIKAIVRRTSTNISDSIIKIGRLEINFSSFTAFDDGTDVPLSHREFEVLKYLYENKNQTVSRDNLLKNVWMQEATTTRTIDNFILKLRQKIETDPNNPKLILTVHGIGYKLIL